MPRNHYLSIMTVLAFVLTGCLGEPEARKPVSHSSGSFMKNSIERNKEMYQYQEEQFQKLFTSDSLQVINNTKSGFWYTIENQNGTPFVPTKKGDIIYFDYEIRGLDKELIYPLKMFQNQKYHVEKENIISGLREGLQLLKKGDIAVFYFPSQMAYGFHGDNDKIETNTPLIIKVKINNIAFNN